MTYAPDAVYDQGWRDAINTAVQRVEELRDPWPNIWPGLIMRAETIAAIKGDQPWASIYQNVNCGSLAGQTRLCMGSVAAKTRTAFTVNGPAFVSA